MSIQGNLNQILGQVGVGLGLGIRTYQESPYAKGKQLQGEYGTAIGTIKDIGSEKNLGRIERGEYSETELADIESRIRGANKTAFDIHSIAEGGTDPRAKFLKTEGTHAKIKEPLKRIEDAIAKARESLAANGQAKIDSNERLANVKELLTRSEAKEKFRESGAPNRTTNKMLNRMERAGMLKGGNDGE